MRSNFSSFMSKTFSIYPLCTSEGAESGLEDYTLVVVVYEATQVRKEVIQVTLPVNLQQH